MSTPITGDASSQVKAQQQVGVTLHNMPKVDFTAITDASHPINQSNLSGKRLGSMVLAVDSEQVESGSGRISLLVAHGSNPEDGWSALFASRIGNAQWTPAYPDGEVEA
ncbi:MULTISPECIES: hypothetical protein [Pseudomonas syringae group]|uniref:hypothetical protein n=1 Tax=Pseudomonas syringae group TaxID=136849 RepID=UPI001903F483|nr:MULTISPECIES: hypothetical protein [Pseudomonas syringae group]MDU8456699.1 hypothetical protein [Pseudomonas syringae group sp. J254-4]QQN26696.1 hypothetical protein JHZ65_24355 [Pseudomonas syringae pv. maculicola]QQQ51265.1 hypothetical protein JJQ97_03185 [Pseudomonas syringae]